jgi:serine/threonine-protein kinase
MRRALAASERAVALDPDLAECYSARGWMRMAVSWDWTGAQADLERAIHDNPRDAATLVRIGNVNAILGHLSDAIAITKRAREIDPMYSLVWYFLALYHNFGGRLDIARDAASRALEISPRHAYALRELGNANLLARDPASALAVFRSHPSDAIRLAGIAMAQSSLGNEEQAARAFDALRGRCATSDAYQIALVHAWRGEIDASYEYLERSLPQKNMRLRYIKLDPLLANIRGDPRYEAVLRSMGLPID